MPASIPFANDVDFVAPEGERQFAKWLNAHDLDSQP